MKEPDPFEASIKRFVFISSLLHLFLFFPLLFYSWDFREKKYVPVYTVSLAGPEVLKPPEERFKKSLKSIPEKQVEKKVEVKKQPSQKTQKEKVLPRPKEPSKPAEISKPVKIPPRTESIKVAKEVEKPIQLQPKPFLKPKMVANLDRKSPDALKSIEEKLKIADRKIRETPELPILSEEEGKVAMKDIAIAPSVKPKIMAQMKRETTSPGIAPGVEISKVIGPRKQGVTSGTLSEDILRAKEGISEVREAAPVAIIGETRKLNPIITSGKSLGPSQSLEALAKSSSSRHGEGLGLGESLTVQTEGGIGTKGAKKGGNDQGERLLEQAKGELPAMGAVPSPLSHGKGPKSLGGGEGIVKGTAASLAEDLEKILGQPGQKKGIMGGTDEGGGGTGPGLGVGGQRKGIIEGADEGVRVAEVLGEKAAFHSPTSPVSIAEAPAKTPSKGPIIEGEEVIPLTLNTNDPNLGPYLKHVRERVLRVWKYPENAQPGLHGKVALLFTIERDGSVSKVKIMDSSGYLALDEGVLDAMRRAIPFYPIPLNIKLKHLPILGNFIYN